MLMVPCYLIVNLDHLLALFMRLHFGQKSPIFTVPDPKHGSSQKLLSLIKGNCKVLLSFEMRGKAFRSFGLVRHFGLTRVIFKFNGRISKKLSLVAGFGSIFLILLALGPIFDLLFGV